MKNLATTRVTRSMRWLLIHALLLVSAAVAAAAPESHKVKLVLQVTVDQLRGDTMTRFEDNFTKGGFRYLLEKGVHYTNAHYPYSDTETAPGHASLATGAVPAVHGIVSNDWLDPVTGEFVYNTEDPRHSYIGMEPKKNQGVSPRNLLASTLGDELVLHSAGRSRAFSVSSKDRGAILPGGHVGKAFWYNNRGANIVSSTYYYDAYPEWVAQWNAAKPAKRFSKGTWSLLYPQERYVARELDDRPFEADFAGMGRTFPHPLPASDTPYFPVVLYVSPMADELTLDFAKTLIDQEQVGQGEAVDYMAVSFSAPDVAGHLFGQSSLEYEDAVLRTDTNLAQLLKHIDDRVGLKHTLIALSADHGGVESPEYAKSRGIPAGRLPMDWIRSGSTLAKPLQEKYGRDDLVAGHSHPYVYLNTKAIADAQLNVSEVEQFVADELVKVAGIHSAITRTQILSGTAPSTPLAQQAIRNFHPERSGNVHYIQDQYWFVHSTEEAKKLGLTALAAIHGSPWSYDTYVPVLFAGPGIPNMRISRRVSPLDIAPTLANYMGVKAPSGTTATVLKEIVDR
jgi:predicted AlkP superfamily pyrophosphatase or phosphodiesterase